MLVFGVSGVVNRALAFMLIPLYTRYIQPREYGALHIMMIFYAALPLVLRFGLGNALLRSWYDFEDDERPSLGTTVFVFLLITAAPILALLAYFAPELSVWQFGTDKYTVHMRIICAMAFLEVFNVVPDTLMRVRNESVKYSICQTVGIIAQLIVIIPALVWFNLGIKGVLIGNMIALVCENGLMFAYTCRQMGWGFNRRELRTMLAFGTPTIFGRLGAVCFQWIDRFFINNYAGQRLVGIYALGGQLAAPITILVNTPFGFIWANMQFSTMKDSDANEYYARMLTYITYVATALALPIAILVEDVLRICAPLKYWDAATVVPWLAAAAVLDAANPVLNVGISIKRRTFINPIIVISSALINIGLNFLLIPAFGIMGAAVATLISYVVMCAIRYFVSGAIMPINYEWRRILIIAVTAFTLFMLSRAIDIERPIISFCARLPFAALFPFVLFLIGFYDEKELAKLRELKARARSFTAKVQSTSVS